MTEEYNGFLAIGDKAPAFPVVVMDDNKEIFHVTDDGDIVANGNVITNDNDALAECFKKWVRLYTDHINSP